MSISHGTMNRSRIQEAPQNRHNGTTGALEMALNVAARCHDCHVLDRQHLKGGLLVWTPHKTQQTTGKKLSIKASPELLVALKAMPS